MIYVLAFALAATIAAVIWYFFMVPLGKERHERELELIRRKLARLEAQRAQAADARNEPDRENQTTLK